GDRRVVAELVRKGIDPEAARAAVRASRDAAGERDERERAVAALAQMLRVDPARSDATLARALERRGFPTFVIYDVLRARARRSGLLAFEDDLSSEM
ncbi:MAG: RecX family transcriptional regulator, partial [bacterium]|nr:RecX family transcriptional regulator [bacterium]